MDIAILIPARLASTRFPAKPLAPISGPDGNTRPAIAYTWEAACAAAAILPGDVTCAIATDDDSIAQTCRALGMTVVMTPLSCRNGTERVAAAVGSLPVKPDIVVNLQGDAPLTPATMVQAVVDRLITEPELAMATVVMPTTPSVLAHLQADAAAGRVGGTTAACTRSGRALYFSKSIIPHTPAGTTGNQPVLLHVGLYAYTPAALLTYIETDPSPLELQEGLEQLRFLEAGLPVGVAVCPAPAWDLIELNNPSDAPLIEAALAAKARAEAL